MLARLEHCPSAVEEPREEGKESHAHKRELGSRIRATITTAWFASAKESWHVNYDWGESWQPVPGAISYVEKPDRWLGMKVIRYEFERAGQRELRNEVWLDFGGLDAQGEPANDWFLAHAVDDHAGQGGWGEAGTYCNAGTGPQRACGSCPWSKSCRRRVDGGVP